MDLPELLKHRESALLDRERGQDAMKKAQAIIDAADARIRDIDHAGRVIADLTGADWAPVRQEDGNNAPGRSGTPTSAPHTIDHTNMILWAYEAAKREGRKGIEPKEARRRAMEKFGVDIPPSYASTVSWRMAQRGQLIPLRKGFYSATDEDAGQANIWDAINHISKEG